MSVLRAFSAEVKLKTFPKRKSHNLEIKRRFAPLTSAVIGGDFFDSEAQVMSADDDFGQNKQ